VQQQTGCRVKSDETADRAAWKSGEAADRAPWKSGAAADRMPCKNGEAQAGQRVNAARSRAVTEDMKGI